MTLCDEVSTTLEGKAYTGRAIAKRKEKEAEQIARFSTFHKKTFGKKKKK